MDLGGSRRGTDMGPSAVRIAGLETALREQGHDFEDLGNVSVEDPSSVAVGDKSCLLYTSPSPRDLSTSRMPSSA